MRKIIENKILDEERALYNTVDADVTDCVFAGPADGESALKECRNVAVKNCSFSLRYPLWHAQDFTLENCRMDSLTRAALWYCERGKILKSTLGGIKALRECGKVSLKDCDVVSPEFGWRCRDIEMNNCRVTSEYFMFESKNIDFKNVNFTGKYSFQYVENGRIEGSRFDTKDAFWHSKNLFVKDSVLKGEYLGWYSEGLTLENCLIIGTQPLCYCKNLKLINCRTENCDLAFEYSEVDATISGDIVSVKNPKSGTIIADSVGEIIRGDCVTDCHGEIIVNNRKVV